MRLFQAASLNAHAFKWAPGADFTLSRDGGTVTRSGSGDKGIFAEALPSEREHRFTVTVEKATSKILVGVASCEELVLDKAATLTHTGSSPRPASRIEAWGVYITRGEVSVHHTDKAASSPGEAIVRVGSIGEVKSAKVDIVIALQQQPGRLFFRINNGEMVEATGVKLPAQVRPWLLMFGNGDCVRFSDFTTTEGLRLLFDVKVQELQEQLKEERAEREAMRQEFEAQIKELRGQITALQKAR